ncbi:MAG: aminotransferase class I/II-fold pyridoxal phosphate-dependent enzyme [Deltaproteobacteria bacterium]|nr:aminotransferase class I/II-fold pyridoxal phosphate-dependent enzyme [Deltaproteobacteria bacterium]
MSSQPTSFKTLSAQSTSFKTCDALSPFGTSIFAQMSQLATEVGAINLSQGFPDFEGPSAIVDAAVHALRDGKNQYARSRGVVPLVEAIASHQKRFYNLDVDPMTEVSCFNGATEGLAASLLGMLNPGDEVILFEPFYDSYPALCALRGAIPKFVTLPFPDFHLDKEQLTSLFNDKTKLILLNTPQNPTGKVFDKEELEFIAELCHRYDAYVLSDEVYEHLTYDGEKHLPMACIDGMWDRTLTLSSSGKTWSFTGWKVGWATGPAVLVDAAQSAHQYLTYSGAAPLQHAIAHAIENYSAPDGYIGELKAEYLARRDFLSEALSEAGLKVALPKGTYFVLADFSEFFEGDDVEFAQWLAREHGVAAIPPSSFYAYDKEAGKKLVRFAFCKEMQTLEKAKAHLLAMAKSI